MDSMKNKLRIVEKEKELPSDESIAWENVQMFYMRVKTLDEINIKQLQRAGKQMRSAIFELLNAVKEYDEIRSKTK